MARDYFDNLKEGFKVVGGVISPVSDAYGKESLVPAKDRLEMCKLAICSDDNNYLLTVESWEALQLTWTPTVQVMKHFKEELIEAGLPEVRVILLAGSDLLDGIENPSIWDPEGVNELLNSFGIAVIERNPSISLAKKIFTSNLLHPHASNIYGIPQFVSNEVSSSKLRLLLRRGHSIKYLTCDRVIEYIYENNLFKTS